MQRALAGLVHYLVINSPAAAKSIITCRPKAVVRLVELLTCSNAEVYSAARGALQALPSEQC
jgi:hypothetical protein